MDEKTKKVKLLRKFKELADALGPTHFMDALESSNCITVGFRRDGEAKAALIFAQELGISDRLIIWSRGKRFWCGKFAWYSEEEKPFDGLVEEYLEILVNQINKSILTLEYQIDLVRDLSLEVQEFSRPKRYKHDHETPDA